MQALDPWGHDDPFSELSLFKALIFDNVVKYINEPLDARSLTTITQSQLSLLSAPAREGRGRDLP